MNPRHMAALSALREEEQDTAFVLVAVKKAGEDVDDLSIVAKGVEEGPGGERDVAIYLKGAAATAAEAAKNAAEFRASVTIH